MRTTLTLNDDVAATLKREAQRAGRSFREILNETLCRGQESRRATVPRPAFEVRARDLGNLKPRLSLNNIAELIEHERARFTVDPGQIATSLGFPVANG